jgi:hypothetical protein
MSSNLLDLATERLSRLPLFTEHHYAALHSDLRSAAGLNLARHAIEWGVREGRQLFSSRLVSAQLADIDVSALAAALARDILDLGVRCRILHEDTPIHQVEPRSAIAVAPHEFFTLGKGISWLTESFVRQCIVFNVEQPLTRWFAAGLLPMLACRGLLDLSPQMAAIWSTSGKPAMHYEPSVGPNHAQLLDADITHPLIEALPERARKSSLTRFSDRPIDLSFFGARSARRDRAFSDYAARVSPYSTYFYFRQRASGPILPNSPDAAITRIAAYISTLSKISLNVHRDDTPYFEWHRIVNHGMAGQSLVISDNCFAHPHFRPNEHFLQDDLRQLPNLIDWVLKTPDGRDTADKLIANSTSLLTDRADRRTRTLALMSFILTANGEI